MTAEILIMNRDAVALAADSAVTAGTKIYNTANKVFALSKYKPVGIMIFQDGNLSGIPWETIIKVYREKRLGNSGKARLTDYADDFLDFLNTSREVISEEVQEQYFGIVIRDHFAGLMKDVEGRIAVPRAKQGKEDDDQIQREIGNVFSGLLDGQIKKFEAINDFPGLTPSAVADILEKYNGVIEKQIAEVFKACQPLDSSMVAKLKNLARLVVTKDGLTYWTGVVIAGFGDSEVFPSFTVFFTKGVFNNRLISFQGKRESVSLNRVAIIEPFADKDVPLAFILGIVPSYKDTMKKNIQTTLGKCPSVVADALLADKIGEPSKVPTFRSKMEPAFKAMAEQILAQMDRIESDYARPFVNTVGILPKDELAALAESLVNLTTIKKRYTTDSETVGGPIDVSIISKGDGLVWIKRKHYFKQELNPHFVENYFREVDSTGA